MTETITFERGRYANTDGRGNCAAGETDRQAEAYVVPEWAETRPRETEGESTF